MIEFKQIIGRGTRVFEGKEYFTIIDFVDAYKMFLDEEWDGEPVDNTSPIPLVRTPGIGVSDGPRTIIEIDFPKLIRIKLRDGKEKEIQHMVATSFYGADGKPLSTEEFIQELIGAIPELLESEDELKRIWSDPKERTIFLDKLEQQEYSRAHLKEIQKLMGMEDCDLYDLLAYFSFSVEPIPRIKRIEKANESILKGLNKSEQDFANYILDAYKIHGDEELSEEKLSQLLKIKYHTTVDAEDKLGGVERIRVLYKDIQKRLYC
jgi:type I restriction enzyme R subunit